MDFVSCGEAQSGWQGKITRIHKLSSGTNLVIKWENINHPYSIKILSGKGKKTKKIFEVSKTEFSGYKKLKISPSEVFFTVLIFAKKPDTQWKYTIDCE